MQTNLNPYDPLLITTEYFNIHNNTRAGLSHPRIFSSDKFS